MSEDTSTKNDVQIERFGNSFLADAQFEPGEVAYSFSPTFTMEDVKASLFDSRYSDPKTLPIHMVIGGEEVQFPVVVSKLAPLYMPVTDGHWREARALVCHEMPDWYLEAWVLRSGFHLDGEVVRVRIYLVVDSRGMWSDGWIQRIPKNPDPTGIILTEEASIHA